MRDIGHCTGCGATYLPPEDLTYPAAGVEASLVECSRCKPPVPIGTTAPGQRRADAARLPLVRRPRAARERRAGWPDGLRGGRRAGDGLPPA
jgi:hypothetical protein